MLNTWMIELSGNRLKPWIAFHSCGMGCSNSTPKAAMTVHVIANSIFHCRLNVVIEFESNGNLLEVKLTNFICSAQLKNKEKKKITRNVFQQKLQIYKCNSTILYRFIHRQGLWKVRHGLTLAFMKGQEMFIC